MGSIQAGTKPNRRPIRPCDSTRCTNTMFEQVFDTVKEFDMTALLIDEYVALGAPVGPRVRTRRPAGPGARTWTHRPAPRPVEPAKTVAPGLRSGASVVAPTAAAGPIVVPAAAALPVRDVAARSSALPERLYWTPRGLAVALGAIGVLFLLMLVTLVTGFLAVSNEPVRPAAPVSGVVLVVEPAIGAGALR